MAADSASRSRLAAVLDALETLGNRLPDPVTLFACFAALVALASWAAANLGVTAVHPRDGSTIEVVNLLQRDGVRRMFTEAVKNFTGFAPLGTVLVAMLGIGVAEATGLVAVSLRAIALRIPPALLTAAIVFLGVNANLAADAGIVVLPPIAALLFVAAGRHPLAGIAAAYAGVTGGFSANLLPSALDVLLAGFTQEAVTASKLLPGYSVQILGNYWFMIAATPLLTVLGTWITERVVEPRLGPYEGAGQATGIAPLTREESRGLVAAFASLAGTLALLALMVFGPASPLRLDAGGALERLKPFFDSMVVIVFLVFFVPGLAYGMATRRIRSDRDVAKMTGDTLATMGGFLALAFVAAQFVAWFGWSNLGAVFAIRGADTLRAMGLHGAPLLVGFVLFAALLNLFITSASAKWAILAPVFVPMFVLLGFTPEATQAVFRVGDSSTNIITPCMPYLPFVLACTQRYVPRAGTGTLLSLMLPYSIVFLVFWTGLLLLFFALGWPIGPGVGLLLR